MYKKANNNEESTVSDFENTVLEAKMIYFALVLALGK